MRYRNAEMKIDQLVSYLNDEKINLSPAFQRGHVWGLKTRKKLVANIVQGLPIPAVFLYKEADGSKYTYNILDGKQRLESLILFIADGRQDVKIGKWAKYFFGPTHHSSAKFSVPVQGKEISFAKLPDEIVRDFREYSIPTVEITLEEGSSLDEVITLFVDINQQGEPVKRFDIVKAMYKSDPLMKSVFALLALEQKRGQDVFYKAKGTDFSKLLKCVQSVSAIAAPNAQVDNMWEKLLEIAIFSRTFVHKKPIAVLRDFIVPGRNPQSKLTAAEVDSLRKVFGFLVKQIPSLGTSRIFTDHTHLYTVITSLLEEDLVSSLGQMELGRRLKTFSGLIGQRVKPPRGLGPKVAQYLEYSAKQTTDASRRTERQRLFLEIVDAL